MNRINQANVKYTKYLFINMEEAYFMWYIELMSYSVTLQQRLKCNSLGDNEKIIIIILYLVW